MSVKDSGMKHIFFLVTCGEDYTFETLDAMKKYATVPFKLQIWYALKNGIDLGFYNRLLEYTDDVIISQATHSFASCQGWAMVYNDYDYIWIFGADCKPLPGFVEKIHHAFLFVPFMVCAGNVKYDSQPDFSVTQPGACPDLLQVYERRGVDLLGATSPNFRTNGHEIVEMGMRIMANRMNFIGMKGLVEEVGPTAPNNGSHNDYKKENLDNNFKIIEKIKEKYMTGAPYYWWSTQVFRELESTNGVG